MPNDYPTHLRVIAAFKAGEDLAVRLESAVKAQNAMADALRSAADEIERLRNGAVAGCETVCPHVRGTVTQHCSLNFTLTDAEREAIEWCLSLPILHCDVVRMMPLRSLLERLK